MEPSTSQQTPSWTVGSVVSSASSDRYPEPVVVAPSSGKHQQSFIILHGRGSNGYNFGSHLLEWYIPGFRNLRATFPDTKFVFPTAAMRRAASLDRVIISQWFDCWSLQDPTEREELQYAGLKESTEYVHQLLKQEISVVGAGNVILWGLSQGWAISMMALLLWEGEAFRAAIGMCGWLPLQNRMWDLLDDETSATDENPFERDHQIIVQSGVDLGTESDVSRITEYLREVLDVPSKTRTSTGTGIPVFVGHGVEDEKVALELGQDAVKLLRVVDVQVDYKEYAGLGHWYSSDMLHDIVLFIERETGWTIPRALTDDE